MQPVDALVCLGEFAGVDFTPFQITVINVDSLPLPCLTLLLGDKPCVIFLWHEL